jgi:uncharacterized OB-fold protein
MEIGIPSSWRRIRERYNLIGSYCENCKKSFFPKRAICPNCRRNGKLIEKKFSDTGKIYSYTTVYSPASGFQDKVPYIIAIVKLDDGPTVIGNVVDADPKEIEIGKSVEVSFRKWFEEKDGGLIHYGFAFRLI